MAGSVHAILVWGATAFALTVGFISIYFVAPGNTGLGVAQAYEAFQSGSNVGNAIALLGWISVSLLAGLVLVRNPAATLTRSLIAFGTPAVLSLYPSAVMSNAVSHVVAVEDSFVYEDWVAMQLVLAGVVALTLASINGLLRLRKHRTQSS